MSDATLLNFKRDCRSLCALASASVSQLDSPGRLGACKPFSRGCRSFGAFASCVASALLNRRFGFDSRNVSELTPPLHQRKSQACVLRKVPTEIAMTTISVAEV